MHIGFTMGAASINVTELPIFTPFFIRLLTNGIVPQSQIGRNIPATEAIIHDNILISGNIYISLSLDTNAPTIPLKKLPININGIPSIRRLINIM